jgi:hypothetical protein
VSGVRLDADRIGPGESVTATATVANDADYPGRATLTVSADGEDRAERTVALDAGEQRTVEIPVAFELTGSYRIAVGDGRESAETTVRVAEQSRGGAGSLATGALALALDAALVAGGAYALRER